MFQARPVGILFIFTRAGAATDGASSMKTLQRGSAHVSPSTVEIHLPALAFFSFSGLDFARADAAVAAD